MNFFEDQDRARRKTTELIVLYGISVVLTVVAINLAVLGVVRVSSVFRGERNPYGDRHSVRIDDFSTSQLIVGTTFIVLLIIGGGTMFKTMQLSGGGPSLAQMLGGRPIEPNGAGGSEEATLRNVVEEMSIASGVPMPRVYVLDNEQGINAFAAGFTQSDAVIGVTRGAITKLTRDELQGVIGHEFSHILNGDMRLNLRLIGILGGIQVVSLIGYGIIRSMAYTSPGYRSSRDRDDDRATIGLLLLGVIIFAIGSVGALFARLIQAAVSRQREFLADASSVQFTRNPAGLVGALRKLGEFSSASRIKNPHAMEAAHLFFANGAGMFFGGLLETHPPLEERIRRLDPTFDGTFVKTGTSHLMDEYGVSRLAGAGNVAPQHLQYASGLMDSLPAPVATAAREPFGARPVVFGLLVGSEPAVRDKQVEMLRQNVEPACFEQTMKLLESIAALGEGAKLPLLNVALPALRQFSPAQAQRFKSIVRALIEADGRVTLFEFALFRLLEKQLPSPDRSARQPMQYFAVAAVRDEAAVLLSALAAASTAQTDRAFEAGARTLDPDNPPALVQVGGLKSIDTALQKLAGSSPAVKKRLIDAALATVTVDGEINVAEAELLRATAATLDVPLPPLLAAAS